MPQVLSQPAREGEVQVPRPRELGYAMAAEWEPHSRCWMAWPARAELWGTHLEAARAAYARLAATIARFEPVTMIVRPDLLASASLQLPRGVSVLPLEHDDSWMRDVAPAFLRRPGGGLAAVCFRFNGWGELWRPYAEDARIARRIADHLGIPIYESELVLEGGAISVDGEGTALLCEPSVLDPARNPGVTRGEVERELRELLGVERAIWLPAGLVDDETKGHVDNVARFLRPGLVLLASDEPGGPHAQALEADAEVLERARDARGRALDIVRVPMPQPRRSEDGRLLTTSYVNFCFANGALLLPAFDDPADAVAYRTLSALFPDRSVIQVEALDIVQGGGGIHCVTREQPAA